MCISLDEWVESPVSQFGCISGPENSELKTAKRPISKMAQSDLSVRVCAAVPKVLFITPWLKL